MPAPRDIPNEVIKDLVKGTVVQVDPRQRYGSFAYCGAADADLAMMSRATKQTRIAPITT